MMASSDKDYSYDFSYYDDFLGRDDDHQQGGGPSGHAGFMQNRTPKLEHFPSSRGRDDPRISESYRGQPVHAVFPNVHQQNDDEVHGLGIVRTKHSSFNHLQVIEESIIDNENDDTIAQGSNAFGTVSHTIPSSYQQEELDSASPLSWIWSTSIKATVSDASQYQTNHGMTRTGWGF